MFYFKYESWDGWHLAVTNWTKNFDTLYSFSTNHNSVRPNIQLMRICFSTNVNSSRLVLIDQVVDEGGGITGVCPGTYPRDGEIHYLREKEEINWSMVFIDQE